MRSLAVGGSPSDKPFKCMTRCNSQTSPEHFCYTLQAYASFNFFPLHLYLLHFPSCFNKRYYEQLERAKKDYVAREPEEVVMERNISVFFKTFCKQVVLHSILSQEEKITEHKVSLAFNMMANNTSDKSEKQLGNVVGKLIVEICQQYKGLLKEGTNRERQWSQVEPIIKEMRANVDKLVKEAENNPIRMLETQFFPAANDDPKMLPIFIKRSFQRIGNVHVINKNKRKQMLEMLQEQFGNLFSVSIPWLKDQKIDENKIYMQRKTSNKEPILTSLPIYLKNIYMPNMEVSLTIAQDIIKLFSQFFHDAKRPFPHLKAKSLYINQNNLQPVFEQAELIMDALGVVGNTNTIEQDIVWAVTPDPFGYQKCHLEYLDDVKWAMRRKYYNPKKKHNNKEGEQQDYSKIQQCIRIDGRQVSERNVLEHIHVWRLLSVLYAIINARTNHPEALAFKVYAKVYGSTPFFFDKYLHALKKIYDSLTTGKIGLRELLNVNNLKAGEKISQFGFTISELCEEFEVCSEEDSILNDLRFKSSHGELFLRIRFIQQLLAMLINDRYFKRLANPKKYIIIYLVQASQNCFQTAFFAHLEQLCPGSRRKLTHQSPNDQGISLVSERKKRKALLTTISDKLKDYGSRKDAHSVYLNSQSTVINVIKDTVQILENIDKIQNDLNQHEIQMNLNPKSIMLQKEYSIMLLEVKQISSKCFNKCMTVLDSFTTSEINGRINNLQEFHRLEDLSDKVEVRKHLAKLFNTRFVLLISAYTRIRHHNWRTFENLVEPGLTKSFKNAIKSIQQTQTHDMETIHAHLSLIESKISEFDVEKLHFDRESVSVL